MKRKEIKQNASKTKEGQTEANLTKKRMPRKRYYKVTVKFAHVGVARYYRDSLYLFAQNGSVAAEKARSTPRVKHDHKDAVLGVVEITKEEYEEGVRKNRGAPYLDWHSRSEEKAHT